MRKTSFYLCALWWIMSFCAFAQHPLMEEAMQFLIAHHADHTAPHGASLEEYRHNVRQLQTPCSTTLLSECWQQAKSRTDTTITFLSDDQSLPPGFLYRHTKIALQTWKNAPWHDHVSFEHFCHYILPYRISSEMIDAQGDSLLREIYAPMIAHTDNMKEAFTIICDTIFKRMREVRTSCPYILDAYSIHHSRQASCEQRCVLLIHILRALGIPCSIDALPFWANYSRVGHAWITLIDGETAYTYQNGKTEPCNTRPVDAAYFPIRYRPTPDDHYPYELQSEKKITKIYRREFCKTDTLSHSTFLPCVDHSRDVSAQYGQRGCIIRTVPKILNEQTFYLCAFRTGTNWEAIAASQVQDDTLRFEAVCPDNIYLLCTRRENRLQPYEAPFLLKRNDSVHHFRPSANETKITLRRKYPLFSHWTNQWGNMKGSTIEAADNKDFSHPDTLCFLNRMPYDLTRLSSRSSRPYRYVRYHASQQTRTPLAELSFYNKDTVLTGEPISYGIMTNSINHPFDSNKKTVGSAKKTGYWIGLDLGFPHIITTIEILPKNDGNDIEPGHRYELFYFDRTWHSLGSKVALDKTLKYFVPENALLLLKDRTRGNEERIFIYDTSKDLQIWY